MDKFHEIALVAVRRIEDDLSDRHTIKLCVGQRVDEATRRQQHVAWYRIVRAAIDVALKEKEQHG